MLDENAFLAALPYDAAVLPDQSDILQEVGDDFWRRTIAGASPVFSRFLAETLETPDAFMGRISLYLGQRSLAELLPPADPRSELIDENYARCYQRVSDHWFKRRAPSRRS